MKDFGTTLLAGPMISFPPRDRQPPPDRLHELPATPSAGLSSPVRSAAPVGGFTLAYLCTYACLNFSCNKSRMRSTNFLLEIRCEGVKRAGAQDLPPGAAHICRDEFLGRIKRADMEALNDRLYKEPPPAAPSPLGIEEAS